MIVNQMNETLESEINTPADVFLWHCLFKRPLIQPRTATRWQSDAWRSDKTQHLYTSITLQANVFLNLRSLARRGVVQSYSKSESSKVCMGD